MATLGPEHDIKLFDHVKSFDFYDHVNDCYDPALYVEGVVCGFVKAGEAHPETGAVFHDCDRYAIRTVRKVRDGKEFTTAPWVFPPVNGTERLFGGSCFGVVKAGEER